MITKWTSHITDPEDKERFRSHILSAKPVLARLGQMLDEEESNLDMREISVTAFDNPNWAYRQAYMNGCRAFLKMIRKAIDLDQGSTNERNITGAGPGQP